MHVCYIQTKKYTQYIKYTEYEHNTYTLKKINLK